MAEINARTLMFNLGREDAIDSTTSAKIARYTERKQLVQRGHGFGSLLGGLLRTVAPLIKRGALALGNRALKTGTQIAGDVLAGENIRTAAKRRTKTAGRDLLQSLLATPSPPGKRVKRTAPKKRITRRTTTNRRQLSRRKQDVFS